MEAAHVADQFCPLVLNGTSLTVDKRPCDITQMSRHRDRCRSIALAALAGCAPTPESTTTGVTTFEVEQTTQPTPTTSTTTGLPDVGTTDEPDPTTGTAGTTGVSTTTTIPDFGDQELGCNGKIDFLFVIDRAHWMEPRWERFHEAFPPFLEELLATFANFDLHFMAVDATNGWGLFDCIEQCEHNNGSCAPVGPEDYPCDHYTSNPDTDCERMGSGVIAPAGFGSSNRDCGVVGGRRFIVGNEQPDLLETVKCISQMGYGTSHSAAEVAMLWSLLPDSPPAHCNEGFLRDDAMLVIVFHSGFANDTSPMGPAGEWAEAIYDLKGGDKDKVAVIGIINDASSDSPTVCPGGSGSYSFLPAAFLHFYIKHKVEGSHCADDYSPYLDEGLELVRELCDADIPT